MKLDGISQFWNMQRKNKDVIVDIASLKSESQSRQSYLPCAWEEKENGGIEPPSDVKKSSLRDEKALAEIKEVLRNKQYLRLLTFNFLIRPPPVTYNGNDYKDERIEIMVSEHLQNYDIVCMQEVFGSLSSRRKHLIQSAGQRAGLLYSFHSPSSGVRSVVDGGCLILSRFPITESDCVSFSPGINADWLARKGALYARIQLKRDVCVHVFTTHLQADYEVNTHHPRGNLPNQQMRQSQMHTLAGFIRRKTLPYLRSNPTWPVILMGDLNINSRAGPTDGTDGPEYLGALRIINDAGFEVHDLLKESHNGQHPITICDSLKTPGGALIPTEPQLTPHNEFHLRRSIDYILLLTPNWDILEEPPTKLFIPTPCGMLCSYIIDMGQTCTVSARYKMHSCCGPLFSETYKGVEEKKKLKKHQNSSPKQAQMSDSNSDDEEEDDYPVQESPKRMKDGASPYCRGTTTTTSVRTSNPENHESDEENDEKESETASSSVLSSISPPFPVATEKASLISAESDRKSTRLNSSHII